MNIFGSSSLSILALGDSYTIGEGEKQENTFPFMFYKRLLSIGLKAVIPEIIATTGWTTRDLLNAISQKPPAKAAYSFIFLLIGVNNQYEGIPFQQYKEDLAQLYSLALRFSQEGASGISILSIPDYAYTPFGRERDYAKISLEIDSYNFYNKKLAGEYEFNYVDITDLSRMGLEDPQYLTSDLLHPSSLMYKKWTERIENTLNLYQMEKESKLNDSF